MPVAIYSDPPACAQAALDQVLKTIYDAVAARGRCLLALAGGSTPKLLYRLLANQPAGAIPWSNVILLWGDERNVPPEDDQSNFKMVKLELLDHLPPHEHPTVHRIPTDGGDVVAAAQAYQNTLKSLAASIETNEQTTTANKNLLVIDCVLLGIGDDAHTASLFPGTAALTRHDQSIIGNEVPQLHTSRVTMSFDQLNAARKIIFLVCGNSKRSALDSIFNAAKDLQQFPAQGISAAHGQTLWILDAAAAEGLKLPQ